MENITVKDLVRVTRGNLVFGNPGKVIHSISTDSRKTHRGDFFFALKGKNYDGHNYSIKAIESGAAGIVVTGIPDGLDKFYADLPTIILVKDTLQALGDLAGFYRSKFSPKVIAVTGSNGKTTTKDMIYSILSKVDTTLANAGSFNNFIGLPLTLFELTIECKYCVLELGISFPGEMDRLLEISKPDIGLVTNIGKTHLEYMMDIESVYNEKKKLVTQLKNKDIAILNIDDRNLRKLAMELDTKVITYGLTDLADIYAADTVFWPDKPKFKLCLPEGCVNVQLPVYGQFNVYNALAASAVAYSLGIDIGAIKRGLEEFKPPEMRMEVIKLRSGATVINDAYNSNPNSVRESLLAFVNTYCKYEKIVVLGDMLELGKCSEQEHIWLGEFITTLPVDKVYLYGDNSRFVLTGINEKNQKSIKKAKFYIQQEELIEELRSETGDNKAILFKASRGIGLEKIIDRMISF